jgi:hypothetical protein
VTAALRRRWPDAAITSTAAGHGRVMVKLPPDVAAELRLAGPGASAELAALALAVALGAPARQLGAVEHRGDAGPGERYVVTLEIAGR